MTKRLLPWLIGVMSLALVGLISVQLFWIKSAFELKEERFAQAVSESLHAVVRQLEDDEIASEVAESWDLNSLLDSNLVLKIGTLDSSAQPITWASDSKQALRMLRKIVAAVQDSQPSFDVRRLAGEGSRRVFTQRPSHFSAGQGDTQQQATSMRVEIVTASEDSSWRGAAIEEDIQVFVHKHDSGMHRRTVTHRSLRQQSDTTASSAVAIVSAVQPQHAMTYQDSSAAPPYQVHSSMSARMIREIAGNIVPIDQRVDSARLRQLLTKELQQRGIVTPFHYEIQSPGRDGILAASLGTAGAGPPFVVDLFPGALLSEPHRLAVLLPERDSIIFESMALTLASSLGFLLVIILSFAFTVFALVKQKKISDVKTDFINNMTHEFKTPIATISLASEALKDRVVASDRQRLQRFVEVIFDENKRLERQVERVLHAAVLDRGDLALNKTAVDAHLVIRRAVATVALHIEKRQGTLHCDLQARDSTIEADEVHLANLINNLLDNAEKYSPQRPVIRLATRSSDRGLFIEVSDRGIGMSGEAQRRIFDKFYRISTGNVHDVKGFGLGLSYVKAIVDAHGGQISVRSEPGSGSTFEVFFPCTSAGRQ